MYRAYTSSKFVILLKPLLLGRSMDVQFLRVALVRLKGRTSGEGDAPAYLLSRLLPQAYNTVLSVSTALELEPFNVCDPAVSKHIGRFDLYKPVLDFYKLDLCGLKLDS